MKVVINKCVGGFSISRTALDALRGMGNTEAKEYIAEGEAYPDGEMRISWGGTESCYLDIERHDTSLIALVENLGEAANGDHALLKIVEIPDGVEYEVMANEMGCEWIAEKHRTWS